MQQDYKTISTLQIQTPKILAIGSSTGGLNALLKIFADFKNRKIDIPIVITQHIADCFDESFVKTLSETSGIECFVGEQGMEVENGKIYIAPANFHMELVINEATKLVKIRIFDGEDINYCKPSVDPLFSSVAEIYGKNVLSIMLTGIGSDGLNGAKKIVENGGALIAQDELSSVVWGMPGAVAKAGICNAILPLDEISSFIIEYSFGRIR